MGGYIGAKTGTLVASASDIRGDISATDTTPEITLKNTTETDADGSRSGKITFKGEQSGGEESTLANIQASHDGTADDEKADLIFRTNDGSDGASPTERVRIDSNGSILTATLGTDNVHLGEGAGVSIASGGNNNVAIGKNAGTSISTGDHNTAVGYHSGDAITTSSYNTSIGSNAATAVSTGERNTALGYGALQTETQGSRSTGLGFNALGTQNTTSATDIYNVGVGYDAGGAVTTGTHNTFLGALAGDATDDGARNTAIGYSALTSNCGNKNTAVGALAGQNVTGINNTIVGEEAGILCTGDQNTFVGAYSASSGGCGEAMTTGSKNTILGAYNGNQNSVDIRTETNQVVISDGDGKVKQHMDFHNRNVMYATHTTGYSIHVINSAASGLPEGIRVQYTGTVPDTQNAHFFQAGDGTSARCVIDTNGNLRNINNSYGGFSDLKLKENIADASSQWDDIKAVKVKKYSMKTDESETANRIGVIAQDLEESGMNGLVTIVTDKDPDTREDLGTETRSVKYSVLYMKAVKALQEAMARIETLETKVAALEAE